MIKIAENSDYYREVSDYKLSSRFDKLILRRINSPNLDFLRAAIAP
jgi:hypothetical protein